MGGVREGRQRVTESKRKKRMRKAGVRHKKRRKGKKPENKLREGLVITLSLFC